MREYCAPENSGCSLTAAGRRDFLKAVVAASALTAAADLAGSLGGPSSSGVCDAASNCAGSAWFNADPTAFMPFGGGQRMCVGYKFANNMVRHLRAMGLEVLASSGGWGEGGVFQGYI